MQPFKKELANFKVTNKKSFKNAVKLTLKQRLFEWALRLSFIALKMYAIVCNINHSAVISLNTNVNQCNGQFWKLLVIFRN